MIVVGDSGVVAVAVWWGRQRWRWPWQKHRLLLVCSLHLSSYTLAVVRMVVSLDSCAALAPRIGASTSDYLKTIVCNHALFSFIHKHCNCTEMVAATACYPKKKW